MILRMENLEMHKSNKEINANKANIIFPLSSEACCS